MRITRRTFLLGSATLAISVLTPYALLRPRRDLVATSGNAAWSWWTFPRAVELDGHVYIGSVGTRINVDVLSLRSGEITTWPVSAHGGNDHNNPAVLVTPNKPAVVIYCRHSDDAYVRVRRGRQPIEQSFGPFEPERRLTAPREGTTYAIAHVVGDTIHLWFRCRAVFWAYACSHDWGVTWSDPQLVFQGDDKLYCAFRQEGERALVAMTTHPHWSGTQAIHLAEIDYSTGEVLSGGEPIGVLGHGPLSVVALEPVGIPTHGCRTWVYDVHSTGVVWSSFDPGDMAGTGRYHLTERTSAGWHTSDVAPTGRPFLNTSNFYAGGAQFDNDGLILVSRHEGAWMLERYGPRRTEVLVREGPDGFPVRAWPVLGGKNVAVNLLTRFDSFRDFEGRIVLV